MHERVLHTTQPTMAAELAVDELTAHTGGSGCLPSDLIRRSMWHRLSSIHDCKFTRTLTSFSLRYVVCGIDDFLENDA